MSKKQIWLIVVLVGGYVTFQLTADVAAAKIIQLAGFAMPAGTFVFALTFTWRDILHKKLGREWARAAIWTAAGCNLFMAGYFVFAIGLPPAVFWSNQGAFAATLGIVWRITIASIVAEVVSESIDTEMYHLLAPRTPGKWQFLRVIGSNLVALPVDSLVFGTLAFAGTMPLTAILAVAWGQIVFKSLVTLISLPGIYLVKERE
jgi:uncharacterized integral membrane protein (TIGR00697 family)